MNKKVVVVGINHAGTSAIRTLALQNPDLQIVAFDKSDNISFLGCGIALAVAGIVKNTKSLFYADVEQLKAMKADIRMKHEVLKIDLAKKEIEVKNLLTNQIFKESFDKLVYAAGSWPFIMPFHKPEYQGIKLCKTYDQALKLIEDAKNSNVKNVVILGAGYIGIELTEAYAHATDKKNVTLIDMENRVIPRYFDEEFTKPMHESMQKLGIKLLMNSRVESLVVNDKNVVTGLNARNVKTDEVIQIPADLVISCVGFGPNTKMLLESLPDLATSRNKAIHINEYTQAVKQNGSVYEDLYVIGDSAAAYYIPSQSKENVALATNAVKFGVVAASHINSYKVPALKAVKIESTTGTNAICVFGFNYSSTGLSFEGATRMGLNVDHMYHVANDRCEFMNEYGQVAIKLVWEKETLRLIGAQIGSKEPTNHTEAIYFLSLAIQKRMTLLDLLTADVFFLPHFNKPFNFILITICKALKIDIKDHKYLVS